MVISVVFVWTTTSLDGCDVVVVLGHIVVIFLLLPYGWLVLSCHYPVGRIKSMMMMHLEDIRGDPMSSFHA